MPRAHAPQMQPRRMPSERQAELAAKHARTILEAWAAAGLPPLAAIELGPVRLEFRSDAEPEQGRGKGWKGRPIGGGGS